MTLVVDASKALKEWMDVRGPFPKDIRQVGGFTVSGEDVAFTIFYHDGTTERAVVQKDRVVKA